MHNDEKSYCKLIRVITELHPVSLEIKIQIFGPNTNVSKK
jgi:hypothetical protein